MAKKKRRSWKTTLWKTVPCDVGLKCWCRAIKTETGTFVVSQGDMHKSLAEFIVKEHNELLELKEGIG